MHVCRTTAREQTPEVTEPVLLARLLLALALSSGIGLEREFRRKPAGLRTLAVVGMGSAVAMIVSKYGFRDMSGPNVALDPSRVAAQIVSGIGFLGAGIIIVRRDSIAGLTTAAVVWLTAMIGMAAGAGMVAISIMATVAYFFVAIGYPALVRRMPRSPWGADSGRRDLCRSTGRPARRAGGIDQARGRSDAARRRPVESSTRTGRRDARARRQDTDTGARGRDRSARRSRLGARRRARHRLTRRGDACAGGAMNSRIPGSLTR